MVIYQSTKTGSLYNRMPRKFIVSFELTWFVDVTRSHTIMSQQFETFVCNGFRVTFSQIEKIILMLVDEFKICIKWDMNTAVVTSVCALVGGIIGGRAGGKIVAAIGAGVCGVTGLAVYTLVSLREVWKYVKEQLKGLFYVVINYLRGLSPNDYEFAIVLLMQCMTKRRELVSTIVDFMAEKLGREIISSLTAA